MTTSVACWENRWTSGGRSGSGALGRDATKILVEQPLAGWSPLPKRCFKRGGPASLVLLEHAEFFVGRLRQDRCQLCSFTLQCPVMRTVADSSKNKVGEAMQGGSVKYEVGWSRRCGIVYFAFQSFKQKSKYMLTAGTGIVWGLWMYHCLFVWMGPDPWWWYAL